jgi:hypothetical protein
MAGAGFGGNASVGHTKRAVLEDLGSEERGERSRGQVFVGFGVRFWERLEGLVGSKTIA